MPCMTEEKPTPESIPVSRRLRAIPRFIAVMSLLFIIWFLLAQVGPRLTLPMSERQAARHAETSAPLPDTRPEMDALVERVAQLEAKLKAFEEVITTSQSSSGTADGHITALQEKIAQLEASMVAAGQQTGDDIKTGLSGQQKDIAGLRTELEQLKVTSGHRTAAITAFAHLQDAIIKGQPFAHHITLLETLLATTPQAKELLAILAPHAVKGIMTEQEMLADFEKAATAALSPDAKPGTVMGNLKTLVRIRKVGTPEGTDDEAIIARAENALKNGNVDDCLLSLRELSPPAAATFATWSQDAQHSVSVRNAMSSLQVLVMQAAPPAAPDVKAPPPPAPAAETAVEQPADEETPDAPSDATEDTSADSEDVQ